MKRRKHDETRASRKFYLSQLIIYQTQDGKTRLEVRLDEETVWLTLNQMADLFQRDKSVISRHIRNVFSEGEIETGGNCCKFCNNSTKR